MGEQVSLKINDPGGFKSHPLFGTLDVRCDDVNFQCSTAPNHCLNDCLFWAAAMYVAYNPGTNSHTIRLIRVIKPNRYQAKRAERLY
ncbi:hypothetical protein HA51_00075 [Pantoea rwandensis]|uniref:Uncharacterized protein n=1 Tax=Pantoea rwandensis TaxID=1076550 RepID=A0A1X1D4C1_9GAMM|nr:hypothetical protein HA51_00075 [Pantoea rwandensis]